MPANASSLRSVRVLRNVLTNYLRFFLSGLIGLVLTPIMVRGLGDRDYGLWVTVFSLTGYFGLFDQGIRPSLVRYVSRDHAAGDREGLSRTISSAVALYATVGVVTLVISAVVAANFGAWFHIDAERLHQARIVVLISGASLALGLPLGVFGAVLSGLQRYDVANGLGIVVGVVRALGFVAILRLGGGLVELAWGSLAFNLLGHALSWVFTRRLLPDLRLARSLVNRKRLGMIGSYSGFAFVGALASSIAFQTDSLVITAFLGTALVTPFALAAGLVDNARTLVHSATWVLSPTASEMDTLGETGKLHGMLIAGAKYSVLLSWPVLTALVIFGRNLMTTWVGERYAASAGLLTILALPTLLSLPQSAASSLLFGVSRHRGVVALSITNALLNLGLSLWWVKPLGLTGVALGTAVPLALVSGLITAWYACRVLKLRLRLYLWQGLAHPGLISLAFVAPALAVQRLWHPLGWIPLGLAVGSCWCLFAVCAWRFGISGPERDRWGQMVPGLFGPRAVAPVDSGGRG